MTIPAIAPYVPTYATRTPYTTAAEYKASPTGVDTSQLIPGADTEANDDALTRRIASASAWADSLCFQVLAATSDVQAGRFRIDREGLIRVPVDNTPLIEVTAVSIGYQPSSMVPLTDLSNVWPSLKVVEIPVYGIAMPSGGFQTRARHDRVYATVQYVNGYANTTLAAPATAGATSITVASALGIFPSLPLQVYDTGQSETVTVAPTYVQGSTTVPLTTATTFTHAAAISVSALPLSIKQAVEFLTSALIKTRGSEAIAMASMHQEPSVTTPIEAGGMEDVAVAIDLLEPFRRVR